MEITVTPEEHATESLTDAHLKQALDAIRTDGYVVLNAVVAHEHLDLLCERMTEDLEKIMNAPAPPHNFVWGNVQQDPPPFPPYVFRDIVVNPWVVQVSKALLGEKVFNNFYSGNTNLPGSSLQPVHVDSGQLWPNLEVAHPAAKVVVNLALDEVTEENGSIELWPGSHLDTQKAVGDDIKVDEHLLKARRRVAPPVRGNTKKGSILIRDVRLWHRGMPNLSDRPRFMIAMIHNRRWLHRASRFQFNTGCEAAFAESDLDLNTTFVDEPIDYLFRNRPYDYHENGA